jgi:hypothetical protein
MAMLLLVLLFAVTSSVDVTGRLRLPGTFTAESVTMTLRAAGPKAERIVATCPVAADGSFRCQTPQGTFDIRIAMPGFVPIYRWAVDLGPPAANLGQIVAQRAASVAGRVILNENHEPVSNATVELLERGDPPVVRQAVKTNVRGFFQFTGVDPGTYGIRAKSKGVSPAHVSNVVVRETAETLLEKPIALTPLAKLEVSISPAMRAPKKLWRVDLQRSIPMTSYSRLVEQKIADTAGNVDFEALESGSYSITVRDGAGTVFARKALEIDGSPPPLFIQIAAVPIRGRLKSGTADLAAQIEFSNSQGESLTIRTNDKGDFEGLLPGEGKWHVDVTLPSRQELTLRPSEIRRRDGEEFARVDLNLPSGRIEGRVVDERGKGVKTGVRLTRDRVPEAATLSDEEGQFMLVGLGSGSVVLDAGNQEMQSGAIPLDISDDTPPITVTLHKSRKLKAWITTPAGYPVAGATIRYWDEIEGGETMSNLSGMFELTLPSRGRAIDLLIVASGVPVKLMRLALPPSNERIHITTAAVPGRLLIRLPRRTPPWPTLSHDGVTASLMAIIKPTTFGGARPPGLTPEGLLVDVDPGDYTVCLKAHCSTVRVPPGAQIAVDASQ